MCPPCPASLSPVVFVRLSPSGGCVRLPAPLSILSRFSRRFSRVCPSLWAFVTAFVACLAGLVTVFASPFGSLLSPFASSFLSWHLLSLCPYLSPALLVSLLLLAGSEDFASLKRRYRHVVWWCDNELKCPLSFEFWAMTAGTGTKLLTTLLHELKRQQVQFANHSGCAVLKDSTRIIPLGVYFLMWRIESKVWCGCIFFEITNNWNWLIGEIFSTLFSTLEPLEIRIFSSTSHRLCARSAMAYWPFARVVAPQMPPLHLGNPSYLRLKS